MNRISIVTSFVTVALALSALPAGAQARREHGRDRGRGEPVQGAPSPRDQARPRAVPRPAPHAEVYHPDARAGRAVPKEHDRGGYGPATSYPPTHPGRPYYSRPYARSYSYAPYRPYYFPRPYYSFRPHLSIGFGLWIGYPVAYPYAYLRGYSPRVYGYYPDGPYSGSVYGGVSFDIRPFDADVFVDGEFVGRTGDFTPGTAPLTLTPGGHHIAIQRDGYRSMEWDLTIQPGQVVPYRGDMRPF
jgi:hypothetical protein